jgi:hypothetical protein
VLQCEGQGEWLKQYLEVGMIKHVVVVIFVVAAILYTSISPANAECRATGRVNSLGFTNSTTYNVVLKPETGSGAFLFNISVTHPLFNLVSSLATSNGLVCTIVGTGTCGPTGGPGGSILGINIYRHY